ncbi:MAG: adenosine-specific kinase [Candidatus Nezhaarchaeota archaeon]|nr:adenosine-specific kinase [Candidatus Nezhaarchaeota archaeon]MCX8141953.1 adenosine-specific kinase [Candidatus Nezhaarchaeota archaeon]MDW8050266.1 adenosine-specific kinase [Nitrososphaerota archaeon]
MSEPKIKVVPIDIPKGANVIIGQAHFIKTVEDIYEALINASPHLKFGIAFNEASGPRLVRRDGNDPNLIEAAIKAALDIGAGHVFVIFIREGYPINVLNAIKAVPEVCRIFCATANPLQVLVAETEQGRGVLGVVDGYTVAGVEDREKEMERKEFLRKIGYKR